MRDLAWTALAFALIAVLIPWPQLLPLSLIGLALVWFATPPMSKPGRRLAKPREERGD